MMQPLIIFAAIFFSTMHIGMIVLRSILYNADRKNFHLYFIAGNIIMAAWGVTITVMTKYIFMIFLPVVGVLALFIGTILLIKDKAKG